MRVETLDKHDSRSDAEPRGHHDIETEDVKQREHAPNQIVAFQDARCVALRKIRQYVAVRQHRGARKPRCTTREDKDSCGFVADVDDVDRFGIEQFIDRTGPHRCVLTIGAQHGFDGWHQRPVDVRPRCGAHLLNDDHLGAHIGDFYFECRRRV